MVDGVTVTRTDPRLTVGPTVTAAARSGAGEMWGWVDTVVTGRLTHPAGALELTWHERSHDGGGVTEFWTEITNTTTGPVLLQRVDSLAVALPGGVIGSTRWASSWGAEFEPITADTASTADPGNTSPTDGHRAETFPVEAGSVTGRSSNGSSAQFEVEMADGSRLLAAVAWSGNWRLGLDPVDAAGGQVLSGGLHPAGLELAVAAGARLSTPHVMLARAGDGDRDAIAEQLHRVGRQHWFPVNDLQTALPVEWNHWWPYEDAEIDEATFLANVDVAAEVGVELATLDAGWFGPPDRSGDWVAQRGDWDLVNTARFPRGLRPVADHVHRRGLRFGLWCEIEALGAAAALNRERPDLPATRDGAPLGYVCLANPDGRRWAEQTLVGLVEDSSCDWVKLDFNLDPGLGCNRTDHGHGAGDGLHGHYVAYYALLDAVRGRFPDLVLENCSSGGLRVDLGMAQHTHLTFLSDPDWPEHSLQLYWEALTTLPPERLLRWSFSQWRGEHPQQTFDPLDPALDAAAFDTWTRIAMLGGFGISLRLPELPTWVRDRLAVHIASYRDDVRRYLPGSRVHRLTGQPLRYGRGERAPAFQFAHPDGTHLLASFRLPGAPSTAAPTRLRGLQPDRTYTLRWLGEDREERARGADLLHAGLVAAAGAPGSALVQLS